jgi:hypothetical protein
VVKVVGARGFEPPTPTVSSELGTPDASQVGVSTSAEDADSVRVGTLGPGVANAVANEEERLRTELARIQKRLDELRRPLRLVK